MPDVSIANLPAFVGTNPANADVVPFTNVGDTTESPLGTTKRMTVAQLFTSPPMSGTIPGAISFTGPVTFPAPNPVSVGGDLIVTGGVSASSASIAGPITAGNITAVTNIGVTGSAVDNRGLLIKTNGVVRWYLYGTNEAESGGDAGTNFVLGAYSDAGTIIDSPITIPRALGGRMTLSRGTDILAPTFSQIRNTQDSSTNRPILALSRGPNNLVVFYSDTSDNLIFSARSGSTTATINNTTNEWTFATKTNFLSGVAVTGALAATTFNALSLSGYYINGVQMLSISAPYLRLNNPDGGPGIAIGGSGDPSIYLDGDNIILRSRAAAQRANIGSTADFYVPVKGLAAGNVFGSATAAGGTVTIQSADMQAQLMFANATGAGKYATYLWSGTDWSLYNLALGSHALYVYGSSNSIQFSGHLLTPLTVTGATFQVYQSGALTGTTSYTNITDPGGAVAIGLGSLSADPNSYYNNGQHIFRDRAFQGMAAITPQVTTVYGTATAQLQLRAVNGSSSQQIVFYGGGATKWQVGNNVTVGSDYFEIYANGAGTAVRISPARAWDFFGTVAVNGAFSVQSANAYVAGQVYITQGAGTIGLRVRGNASSNASFRVANFDGFAQVSATDATEAAYVNMDFLAAGYQFNNGPVIIPTVAGLWLTGGPFTPSSSSAAGSKGQFCWDNGFLYICIATNSWRRITSFTF